MSFNGWLNIYKEPDITSHDVVAKVRRVLKFKKVGHAGTLDPMATGVMVVALGKATRLIRFLKEVKTYKAEVFLGITTDTLDAKGKITSENEVKVTENQIQEIVKKYIGIIEQIPPMYSAIQKDGKRLYELARNGIEIEREKRTIEIYDIKILSYNLPKFEIEVFCQSGTYIRTLADDIGKDLGCGAHLSKLERTNANNFLLENSLKIEDLSLDNINEKLINMQEPINYLEKLILDDEEAFRYSNGQRLRKKELKKDDFIVVKNKKNDLLGIAKVENNILIPEVNFSS
ncbi:MAG: tRNA pseudouridine(55) synthase TruB [Candidatus Sericytochromatia bacterium]